MKNFKEISELIKIGQTIEYNIMDWFNYYNHLDIKEIDIKGFNEANYLVLVIKFKDKNRIELTESLTVGIHKDELVRYKNYEQLLYKIFNKFTVSQYGYAEKYGLNCVTIEKND